MFIGDFLTLSNLLWYIQMMYLVSPVKGFRYSGLVAHYLFLISERVYYLGWEGRGGLKVNI